MESQTQVQAAPLERVVTDVLADLAFLVGEGGEIEYSPGAAWIEAHIEYRGPQAGAIRCWCTEEFSTQLAANLLGLDVDSDEAAERRFDAVCEMMNVLCGQFVTTRFGVSAVFNLTLPKAVLCPETPAPPTAAQEDQCALMVEHTPLICLHVASAG